MIDYDHWGEKPLPRTDPDTEPFWDAAREGDLVVQHCGDCDNYQFYPRVVCRHCWSRHLSFEPVPGTGTVYAATTSHVPGQSGYDDTPYGLALVDIDLPEDGDDSSSIRLMSHILAPPTDVTAGDAVAVTFEPIGDGSIHLPVFEPVD